MTILEKLKKYKVDNNVSMYSIAKDLDVPYQTVYYWFSKGVRPIKPYTKIIEKYINDKSVKGNK